VIASGPAYCRPIGPCFNPSCGGDAYSGLDRLGLSRRCFLRLRLKQSKQISIGTDGRLDRDAR
jgi:hypothetical protein